MLFLKVQCARTHRVQLPFKHYKCDKTHKDCYGQETDVGQHVSRQIT